ncbi:unnamed protein product [Trichogramma brassicae]|uniref:Uncharacterized protein n=1 Tax=Trichogramma brassicae TaxID=86971 RepID=A0A6H5HXH6_9HYME|nr:unnamed protein product [Trichogramma brassicae]
MFSLLHSSTWVAYSVHQATNTASGDDYFPREVEMFRYFVHPGVAFLFGAPGQEYSPKRDDFPEESRCFRYFVHPDGLFGLHQVQIQLPRRPFFPKGSRDFLATLDTPGGLLRFIQCTFVNTTVPGWGFTLWPNKVFSINQSISLTYDWHSNGSVQT